VYEGLDSGLRNEWIDGDTLENVQIYNILLRPFTKNAAAGRDQACDGQPSPRCARGF